MSKGWSIEYVEIENTKPFEKFILGLSTKERAKVFETINYFFEHKKQNLLIKESLSKHLEDGIFEIRVSLFDKIVRNLYFYESGAKIIISHGFIKKTQKNPRKEIEKAKNLRKKYQARL